MTEMLTPPSRVRLRADESAPRLAREWLGSEVRLDRVRGAEAGLLLSELVTGALGPTVSIVNGQVTISADPGPGGVVIGVEPPPGRRFVADPHGFRAMLLERIARRWGREEDKERMWFEVPAPGGVERGISSLETDDLFDLVPGDDSARDEVIRRFEPFALGIARRYRGKGISDDDLQQVAMFGLLRALERYDPNVGRFEPYAAMTIGGELKRHLRDRGWSLKVPRPLKERALEVRQLSQELTQKLGRPATPDDLAAHLGIDVDDVSEALASTAAYYLTSLDTPNDDSSSNTILDSLCSEDLEPSADDGWHAIGGALALLPDRERQILHLRFFEDLTQSEIADEMGISQMHVSRLLARALERLRVLLA